LARGVDIGGTGNYRGGQGLLLRAAGLIVHVEQIGQFKTCG
jgi:hypothetical protein